MSVISAVSPVYNPPMEPYISVIHRDEDILVLNKPSGLLSVPGRDPLLADSLASRVQQQFPQALMIHRLDKDTSGVVLMSLNRKAHAKIAVQFAERSTEKTYIAVVWGRVENDQGLIDLPLGIDAAHKPRHHVDYQHGKVAQTRYQVLERLANSSRMQLTPLTGRTHQLRVHMKALGHVILGDEFYAEGAALKAADRLLLHAQSLRFCHPDGSTRCFTVPCPF